MKTMAKLAVAALLGVTLLSSTATADVKKGQKIYLKKLKAACGFSGAKFAHMHTQDEWEAINEAGKFVDEVVKICPKAEKKMKAKYAPDVYDFAYEYAKDSGNIPSC
jgi:hypothetical protein